MPLSCRSYGASNIAGTCLWCGDALREPPERERSWNTIRGFYLGGGHFCTAGCAVQFAVQLADRGKRLVVDGTHVAEVSE